LTVNVWLDMPGVLGLWFEWLIDDYSTAMLFGCIEAAAFDVSINSPARDAVTGCIFIDGEEELRFAS